MVKGDMCLKIMEKGEPKDINIKEGQVLTNLISWSSLIIRSPVEKNWKTAPRITPRIFIYIFE